MSAIIETEITHKYLMGKTKEDMASLTMWIVGLRNRESIELAQLKLDLDAAHAFADIDRQRLKDAYTERDALKKELDEMRISKEYYETEAAKMQAACEGALDANNQMNSVAAWAEDVRLQNIELMDALRKIQLITTYNQPPSEKLQDIANAVSAALRPEE